MTVIINGSNTPTAGAVAVGDGTTINFTAAGTAGQILTSNGASVPTWTNNDTGTVTSASVVSANGFAGTVATATTTPAITLSTSITGVLKGNGTALSAATAGTDYIAPPSGTALLKANSGGALANAVAGTDYVAPSGALGTPSSGTLTNTTGLPLTTGVTGTLPVANGGTGATSLTENNVILGNGTSAVQVVAPSTAGNVLTSNGTTWASTTPPAGVSLSANNTWTGTQTLQGSETNVATILQDAAEKVFIVAGNNNTNNTGYFYGGSVTLYTTNNSANWTQNLTFSNSTSVNTVLSVGQSLTIAILSTNGGTAYYPTSFQVDGSSVTPKWQGGTAPSSGNASSIDVYTYTIIKTASATFTVLASQTKFA
jgi:hypothetical protein